ncbi:MAG: hypothetical protein ACREHD_23660 [Pirellulales bacterium]
MKRTKARRSTTELTTEQLKQLRNDRALIAKELPDLDAKHQRLCDAAQEPTHSGALRRAIHASRILLDDLADRAGTELGTLDGFLTGKRMLTSDVIDRLTKILQLKLEPANGKPKPRRAKAD